MDVILNSLLQALNQIEVRGRENLELLHGSILLVEKLKASIDEVTKNEGQNAEGSSHGEVCQPDEQP